MLTDSFIVSGDPLSLTGATKNQYGKLLLPSDQLMLRQTLGFMVRILERSDRYFIIPMLDTTVDSTFASRPAAPGSILGNAKLNS